MTRHCIHRCLHCQDVYTYQASGGGFPQYNSRDYCPTCKEAIQGTLKDIPAKRRKVWLETTVVSFETLQAWGAANLAEVKEKGGIPVRQVFSPLFDLEKGATKRTTGVHGRGVFQGRYFRWTKWTDDREPAVIEEQLELIVATGKTSPWRNYTR